MKQTRLLMGMPITINIVDSIASQEAIESVFDYFMYVDGVFSTYKETSEISQINKGVIKHADYSKDMKEIFSLAEQTKKDTNGYFDILYKGAIDPSGLVKGWAIQKASTLLSNKGFKNFFIDAGGDVQVSGKNERNEIWRVGIRSPFNRNEHVKVIALDNKAIATSGTAIRGKHIYNPHKADAVNTEIVSLTVIGQGIYDADRFATAAFAMGEKGIEFVEALSGFEGYMIAKDGMATYTSKFEEYVV